MKYAWGIHVERHLPPLQPPTECLPTFLGMRPVIGWSRAQNTDVKVVVQGLIFPGECLSRPRKITMLIVSPDFILIHVPAYYDSDIAWSSSEKAI